MTASRHRTLNRGRKYVPGEQQQPIWSPIFALGPFTPEIVDQPSELGDIERLGRRWTDLLRGNAVDIVEMKQVQLGSVAVGGIDRHYGWRKLGGGPMERLLSNGDRCKQWGQESSESDVALNKQAEGHYIAMVALHCLLS